MIIDSHVHMGQFYGQYFTPEYISTLMQRCGVSFYLISSTTTCEENYNKVAFEFRKLLNLDGGRALPCLWLTESFLENERDLFTILAMYKWRCLKIHPALHPEEWRIGSSSINKVFKIAAKNELPLLIHTGEDENCCSIKYEEQIKLNPDVNVILAHGRPLAQVIDMCQKFPNVYVDTAFMPVKNILNLVNKGIADRIIWGSDMFLPLIYYPKIAPEKYYINRLRELQKEVSNEILSLIIEKNASALFGINE